MPICGQIPIEVDSYGLDQYVEKCTDIPVIREINGGTVFKITYEPEEKWNNAMKGAFEYACKIWEEQLPNTLPINIHVAISPLRGPGSGKLLSRVFPESYADEELASRMKYVLLAEYNTGKNRTFMDSITNQEIFFNIPDITITYNQNMLDEFSFSIDSTPVDKYDFVTVALRDIARGLGFISGFTANVNAGAFDKTSRVLTYYEKKIREAIGTNDVHTAYANSTQGTLALSVPYYGNLNLYAPNVWQNGVSLNYFVPDQTKKISELLTYDFGRGSVIRDISDKYNTLFYELHGWQAYNLVTGGSGISVISDGTTENIFNYNGSIKIEQDTKSTSSILNDGNLCSSVNEDSAVGNNGKNDFILSKYLFPYSYMYPDSCGYGSWLVSLLKKDGTWDLVYRYNTGTFDIPLEIIVKSK